MRSGRDARVGGGLRCEVTALSHIYDMPCCPAMRDCSGFTRLRLDVHLNPSDDSHRRRPGPGVALSYCQCLRLSRHRLHNMHRRIFVITPPLSPVHRHTAPYPRGCSVLFARSVRASGAQQPLYRDLGGECVFGLLPTQPAKSSSSS